MDQYVSWSLSTEELMLDTITEKFEEFCNPQSNEVRARFDLLTNFWQGNRSVDEWYNAVQSQVPLAKYPRNSQDTSQVIFWFFLKDEKFVSKTINESNIDLDKFPASKVRQPVKRWKVQRQLPDISNRWQMTPRWHKIILCNISTQIFQQANTRRGLLWNLEHPVTGMMQGTDNQYHHTTTTTRKLLMPRERCQQCGDSVHIEDFQCPAKNIPVQVLPQVWTIY